MIPTERLIVEPHEAVLEITRACRTRRPPVLRVCALLHAQETTDVLPLENRLVVRDLTRLGRRDYVPLPDRLHPDVSQVLLVDGCAQVWPYLCTRLERQLVVMQIAEGILLVRTGPPAAHAVVPSQALTSARGRGAH